MSPTAINHETAVVSSSSLKDAANGTQHTTFKEPLVSSGSLDRFTHLESTPPIGREYPELQLSDLMSSPERDQYTRDLAIVVSQRGVVFLRAQSGLTVEMQKEFIDLLGKLSGRPETSGLHVHPLIEGKRDVGVNEKNDHDEKISVISSQLSKKLAGGGYGGEHYMNAKRGWHSDMTFEHIPSDYAILKMRVTPSSGGDTLWASGYEAFDRISRPYQQFLESLTATHNNPGFVASSQRLGFAIHPGPRGAPENVGTDLIASHPIIRTNPVTGWKSLYSVLDQVQRINELSKQESDEIMSYLGRLIHENHDLQVRMKWGKDDVAIWDNRSTYHTATVDFDGSKEVRTGNRAVSMGERPYLDPNSKSRREALGLM
ncbi:hypothetical protein MMC26_007126 [Xylographa opegraphella]|nr:hypothetical protein [Xylographa opegraphella]